MKKIVLMHQDGCPQCKMVEMLLKKYGVEHESCKDIDAMIAKGIMHTPALIVDDKILQGKEMMEYINQFKK